MSSFQYHPLKRSDDVNCFEVRLLRLLPARDRNASLACELEHFFSAPENRVRPWDRQDFYTYEKPLNESPLGRRRIHSYFALSYVWGDSGITSPIYVNGSTFHVTTNLKEALLHLRDFRLFPEQWLWVDAICINQADLQERSSQVQRMFQIFEAAEDVIAWLGPSTVESDLAMDAFRPRLGHVSQPREENSTMLREEQDAKEKEACKKLLQRPWFRRVWIVQEVAAALSITFMCGNKACDGEDLRSKIPNFTDCTAIEPILAAIQWIGKPLYSIIKLVEDFHEWEASDPRDKVFALLGISTEALILDASSRYSLPNYSLSLQETYHELVRYAISPHAIVHVDDDCTSAIIECKGIIIGDILPHIPYTSDVDIARQIFQLRSSVVALLFPNLRQKVGLMEFTGEDLGALRANDIVCLLSGASRPTIVRRTSEPDQAFHVVRLVTAEKPWPDYNIAPTKCIAWNHIVSRYGLLERESSDKLPEEDFTIVWSLQRTMPSWCDITG